MDLISEASMGSPGGEPRLGPGSGGFPGELAEADGSDAAGPARGAAAASEVLISFEDGAPWSALFEDGRLVEVDFDLPDSRRIVGNIYKGRVQNVLRGMQAAFVDIGLERNAFLFVDDALPEHVDVPDADVAVQARAAADIADLVRPGQDVLVQVLKEPVGAKGARVSRALSLPGRHLVLVPGIDYVGVSRRIPDPEERQRLRLALGEVVGDGLGAIVRTASEGCSAERLRADWAFLRAEWRHVLATANAASAPALVHRDLGVVERVVRDRLGPHVRRVVVDEPEQLRRVRSLVAAASPDLAPRVVAPTPQESRLGLFAARAVDAEIERAMQRRVPLPNGGYLVVDQTEALTAIDVNTGRYVGSGAASLDDTFYATNVEAAREIARQLRLRDIGGIIVIDFIDMDEPQHRKGVVEALQAACGPDRRSPHILGFTQLGLVEMTRKKSRQSLRDLMTRPCPTCDGRGRILSEEAAARRVRRRIRAELRDRDAEAVLVEVHPSVAALVIGPGGTALRQFEQETGRAVFVRGSEAVHPEEVRVAAAGGRREVEVLARPVREGQLLDVTVEEPHATSRADGIARLQGYVLDVEGGAALVGQRVRVEITRAHRTYARARPVS